MAPFVPVVIVAKAVVAAVGLLAIRASYRAYRRTGSRALRSLTVAFGCIVVGEVFGVVIDRLVSSGGDGVVGSVLIAVGFAFLGHALLVADTRAITDAELAR